MTYNVTGLNIVANTTAGKSWVEEQLSGVPNLDLTLGTVFFIADEYPEKLKCRLWTPGDTTIYLSDSEDYPSCPTTASTLVFTKE